MRRHIASLGVGAHRLSPPQVAPSVAARARLLDRLDTSGARVISVTAGAGYGKSTLLSCWVASRPEKCAWLQLEQADNDPVRLVRSVVCSLQVRLESNSLLDIAAQLQPDRIDRALAALAAELDRRRAVRPRRRRRPPRHRRGRQARCFDQLVAVISPYGRVVLSGRSDPSVRSARRLLEGDLDVLRAEDLRFTDDEAASVFSEIAESVERRRALGDHTTNRWLACRRPVRAAGLAGG